MVKFSSKIVSGAVIVIAAGAITATAATANQPQNTAQQTSSTIISSIQESSCASTESSRLISSQAVSSRPIPSKPINSFCSSSVVSSKGKTATVADGTNEIQKATDNGVSQIKKATDDGVSEVKQAQEKQKVIISNVYYNVVNPKDGSIVGPDNPNYETYKSELGGDAGTVPTTKSTACQAAIKKIQDSFLAKKKAASSSQIGENTNPTK